jgi:beta-mannosidase
MYQSISLNGTWDLCHNDDFPQFLTAENLPGRHAFKARVPAPIHEVLMEAGHLDDPRVGLNSLRARWVEEVYWAYRRTFPAPEGWDGEMPAWLVFQRLEMNAVIYLNGVEVGRHANAHRPARFDVTRVLRADGDNTLVVLIDAGLFDVSEKPGVEYRDSPQARLTKIHWQRRGQWQRGWDWQQRLLNVGILGDVRLEWSDHPIALQWQAYATLRDDLKTATITVKVSILNPTGSPFLGSLALLVGEKAFLPHETMVGTLNELGHENIDMAPGESIHCVQASIDSPQLWWPIGHGEQWRYPIDVRLRFDYDPYVSDEQAFTTMLGVRKVEVDQSPHPVQGRYFILKINNRPIFCKGGNWVPADMLHSTVTPERYRELVDLAIGANFNLLRIWGGGIFADPAFLDYCDERGVLVWHDLLFACSKYPGDYPEFAAEVRREVTWAVREMAHHASLVVWCGNNEIEEGDWNWGYDHRYRTHPHYAMFHHDLPQIVTHEDPSKFYWISSPYSPDYKSPTDPTVGDQHPWRVSLQMAGGADWWVYRNFVDRFPNEGGVLGCSTPATLKQFLPEKEQYVLSPSWEHHDNPFAINDITPGTLGHAYQTVTLWTGLDPFTLDMERYAYVSGLLQAEGITEYIHNYRHRMFSSASAVFWMYNDSWPATHSWTIVDYYRRKRLPYHPVRRAFDPVTVVCAQDEDGVGYWCINESAEPWRGRLYYGTFAVDGGLVETDEFDCELPPNAAVSLGNGWSADVFSGEKAFTYGAFAVLYDTDGNIVAQHRAFFARFGEMKIIRDPAIEMSVDNGVLTLKSDAFCWGVCLDENGDTPVPDNLFDLLPGIPYTLPWDERTLGEPRIVRLGNRDALP